MSNGKVTGAGELLARLQRLPITARTHVEQAVLVGAGMIETTAKDNIRNNGSVVTGNLFGSVGTVLTKEDGLIVAEVGTAVKYAPGYEFGLSIGEADFNTPAFEQAIIDWVRIKGIAEGKDVEPTAWAIITHIREFGTKPHPFLIPAYQEHVNTIKALIEKALGEGVRDVS
jgi:hypothetical protein